MIRQGIVKRLIKLEAAIIPDMREVDPLFIKFIEHDPEAIEYLNKLYELSINDPSYDSLESKKLIAEYSERYDDWKEKQHTVDVSSNK